MYNFHLGFLFGFATGLAVWLAILDPMWQRWLELADAAIRETARNLWRRL
jgi:hypothetical protein